jgi:hypothetical protein
MRASSGEDLVCLVLIHPDRGKPRLYFSPSFFGCPDVSHRCLLVRFGAGGTARLKVPDRIHCL